MANRHSGVYSDIHGWMSGVKVTGTNDTISGDSCDDEFRIELTSGSGGRFGSRVLGTFKTDKDGRFEFVPSAWTREQISKDENPVI